MAAIDEYLNNVPLIGGSPDMGNRYAGGSTSKTQPFVKGYFQVFFGLPANIFGSNSTTAAQFLSTTCVGFTPPGDRQITMIEQQGQGGVGASFLAGQQITRNFSLMFDEYQDCPIFNIHHMWTGYINPYLGVSAIADNFDPSEYKGNVWVIQTKPVGNIGSRTFKIEDIIKVFVFSGVFPLNDPLSMFDSQVMSNDKVQLNVQYTFDGFPLSDLLDGIKDSALKLLNNAGLYSLTKQRYDTLVEAKNIGSGVA